MYFFKESWKLQKLISCCIWTTRWALPVFGKSAATRYSVSRSTTFGDFSAVGAPPDVVSPNINAITLRIYTDRKRRTTAIAILRSSIAEIESWPTLNGSQRGCHLLQRKIARHTTKQRLTNLSVEFRRRSHLSERGTKNSFRCWRAEIKHRAHRTAYTPDSRRRRTTSTTAHIRSNQ
jgi:hypothetical protein